MHPTRTDDQLRVLVVIASFGEKNLECLRRVIRTYQSMTMHVDVIVTAEAKKSVDLGVRVVVGTPTRNPRSLPFAHKKVFADNIDSYDLYIYSEDDIHVQEDSIRSFVQVTSLLASDEIAGFIRYEVANDGARSVPDAHGTFHWRPESVRRRGDFLIAEFTNEHSGFYVLTNSQLRTALASGTFLRLPYEGRYEMLESAATDIYVNYGFKKVVCISHIDSFLVHHMPNRYVGRMGIPLTLFREQIQTMTEIYVGARPARILCAVEPRALPIRYGKTYDEIPSMELLRIVPLASKTILSVGCGFGAAEQGLRARGAAVTAFPLDSVVGASAERQGFEVIPGSLDECLLLVKGRRFDCVLMTNLIHLLPDPETVLEQCAHLVGPAGSIVIEGRNFWHLPAIIKRFSGFGDYGRLRSFAASGIHTHGPGTINSILSRAGFTKNHVAWSNRRLPWPLETLAGRSGRFGARTWILHTQRCAPSHVAGSQHLSQAV